MRLILSCARRTVFLFPHASAGLLSTWFNICKFIVTNSKVAVELTYF